MGPRFPAPMIAPYYLIYAIMVASIYIRKLLFFYNRLKKYSEYKDSLYETYFDIRLNMELYKTFTFHFFLFCAICWIYIS
jgi:hypothetical protein